MPQFDPNDESIGRYWVVVADAHQARIFHGSSRRDDLKEFHEMSNEDARKKGTEIDTDRPGRRSDGNSHSSAMSADPVETAKSNFANDVTEWLELRRAESRFDIMTIIAAPSFLGDMRKHFTTSLKEKLIHEVDKNLTGHKPEDIRKALDKLAD